MNNKLKLEHANKYGYPVRVTCKSETLEGVVIQCSNENDYPIEGFRMPPMKSHFLKNYSGVISVEPLEPEVEKAENVYNYIQRRIDEADLDIQSTGSAKQIVDQAQVKYGSVDGEPEEVNEKPDKPSILDEMWKLHDEGKIDNQHGILRARVYINTYNQSFDEAVIERNVLSAAMVALPDCLGALVNIRDAKRRTMQGVDLHDPNVTITMTVDDWMVVVDALKKARVE